MSERVAVIHDWLTGMRGGEAVLEGILAIVPNAELFTLFHFPGSVSQLIESRPIHTSPLQRIATKDNYRKLLPLFPRAVRAWDLSSFDLVISSSHAAAKGVDAKSIASSSSFAGLACTGMSKTLIRRRRACRRFQWRRTTPKAAKQPILRTSGSSRR